MHPLIQSTAARVWGALSPVLGIAAAVALPGALNGPAKSPKGLPAGSNDKASTLSKRSPPVTVTTGASASHAA